MTPAERTDVFALLQAIGVVAVYAFIKDGVPRLLGRNNNKCMTPEQHDKECDMKLTPIKDKLNELHVDFKEYMKSQGVVPTSERKK